MKKFKKVVNDFKKGIYGSGIDAFETWNVMYNEFSLDGIEDEIKEFEIEFFGATMSRIHQYGILHYFAARDKEVR